LVRPSGLHVLFVQQVQQQVLVSLDQPLRVDLSVFQLLVSVPLNPLEEGTEGLLLLLPQKCFLFLNGFLHLETHLVVVFLLFHLLTLNLQKFGFLISLHKSQLANFVLEFHQLPGQLGLRRKLSLDSLVQLLDFECVFLFEFFEGQVGSGLVVGHVVVPSTRKL